MSELLMADTATSSLPVASGLTVEELWAMPDVPGEHRQLVDGELYVNASPVPLHQRVGFHLAHLLELQLSGSGAKVFPAPLDVVLADDTVVQPDVVVYEQQAASAIDMRRVIGVFPTLVVEVSSPSTRRLDVVVKRERFARAGIPEYWFVDLDHLVVDVHRNGGDRPSLEVVTEAETLTTTLFPGVSIAVGELLDPDW